MEGKAAYLKDIAFEHRKQRFSRDLAGGWGKFWCAVDRIVLNCQMWHEGRGNEQSQWYLKAAGTLAGAAAEIRAAVEGGRPPDVRAFAPGPPPGDGS